MYTGEDTQNREVTITAGNVLSIIPFTLALILKIATGDAFLAMICAIVVGAVMLNGLIEVFLATLPRITHCKKVKNL